MAKYILTIAGCNVDAVGNGQEAIEAFQLGKYDLIFMDVQMPVVDGVEATKKIREIEDDRIASDSSILRTPIVACTANAMKGDREKYLAIGMDDYMDKPIDLEKISVVLERWGGQQDSTNGVPLGRQISVEAISNKDEGDLDEAELPEIMDVQGALTRAIGDAVFLKTLVYDFLAEQQLELDTFSRLKNDADYDQIKEKGHTLKGAAMNVGANRISEVGLAIEMMGRQKNLNNYDKTLEGLEKEFRDFGKFLDSLDWENLSVN